MSQYGYDGRRNNNPMRWFALAVALALGVVAMVALGQSARFMARASLSAAQAARAARASGAAAATAGQPAVTSQPAKLPASNDPWTETAFINASRARYAGDQGALARIALIGRITVPSSGVLDIYTSGAPDELQDIAVATLPDLSGPKITAVNIIGSADQRVLERITIDPGTGTANITFPP